MSRAARRTYPAGDGATTANPITPIAHHQMPTLLVRPAAGGVDEDECTVRALIAIIGHTPGAPATWDAPPVAADYEIEIRDEHGQPQPDWQDDLSPADYDRLVDQAADDWQATVDAELADAAEARIDLDDPRRRTA